MEKTTSESRSGEREVERWIEVDRWGGALAGRQGQLDVELGDWLLAARAEEVHRHLGFGSMMEYVERRVALKAHAAAERLRVAESLTDLPATREALRTGALSWSVVRELTRVAVAETEGEWLAAASGKTAREVEQLVSGRRPGQTRATRATRGSASTPCTSRSDPRGTRCSERPCASCSAGSMRT